MRNLNNEKGASLYELLLVIAILTILATISIFYFAGHERLYKPDEEALKLVDLLQEARQRSLTQRQTMRVEIDVTANMARLINENGAGSETDDKKIREVALYPATEVIVDSQPTDITSFPSDPLAAQAAIFQTSNYPDSVSHRVLTLRFTKDGNIYNAGDNPVASNATITGGTMFIWTKRLNTTDKSDVARAITFIGTTGSVKAWEYNYDGTTPETQWKDSRRSSSFGQSGNSNSNSNGH